MERSEKKKTDLERFEEDINKFHEDLKKENFSDEEIKTIFEPLFLEKNKWTKRRHIVLAIPFIVYALLQSEYIYTNVWWYLLAITRILLIKVLPYYDWTHLKDQQCLIPKWWEPEILETFVPNCNLCENLYDIYAFDNLTYSELKEFYLEIQKPVILTDDTWPDLDQFFTRIIEDDFLLTSIPCSLETNMIDGYTNLDRIMDKILVFTNFFVHFQNCEYESMKHFRKYAPKPKNLPHSISPIQYNWLLWTKNYAFPTYKQIELVDSEEIKIIGQMNGRLSFRLSPPTLCQEICANLEIKLEKNEFLIFTNFWTLDYKNLDNSQDNVAVISEAHYLH